MAAPKRVRGNNEFNATKEQQEKVLTNLYNLREDGKPETVVLECKDGRVLAHKSVLSAGSDYFCGMFSHANIENENNKVSFPDMSVGLMNIIVKFIYGQDIPTRPEITDALIYEIIIAADKLQLIGLFEQCWNLYTTPITVDNFLNVWQLAKMFNVDEMIRGVRLFILNHMKQISTIDIFSDITLAQLQDLIEHNVHRLEPRKIGEFVAFLLTWGTKNSAANQIDNVISLILKCKIGTLPNYILRNLMISNPVVASLPAIYKVLSEEASVNMRIYAFVTESGRWKHSVNYLTTPDVWSHSPEELRHEDWFPAVSRSGEIFFFKFSQLQNSIRNGFVALNETTRFTYCQVEQLTMVDPIASETSDYREIFFRRTNTSYACFNFGQNKWRTIHFREEISDCRSMLLATNNGKYLFDLDERRIKIADISLETYVTKEKLPGNWQSIKCRSLNTETARKLMFFQKLPNSSLLVYDYECDSWSVVPLPNIMFDVFMYVSHDEDCLIFEKTDVSVNVYSLSTMMKVTEYVIPNEFNGRIHFDLSIQMGGAL